MLSSHLASKRRQRDTLKPFFVFGMVFVGVLVLLGLTRIFSSYKTTGMATGFFSFASAADAVFDETEGLFQTKKSVLRENVILKEKIKVLEESIGAVAIVEKENQELKNILGRLPDGKKVVLSRVLSRPQATPYDTLIIDQGATGGISVGDTVLADGVYAIGRVVEVADNKSTVSLFSTPEEETPATLANANLAVTLVGRGGGNFTLTLPRDIEIIPDEYVVTFDGRAYVVGEVLKELSDPRDPVKTIVLRSPANFWHLSWVQVLTESVAPVTETNE